ncbi:MAG TPA: hypothetical protein VHY09_00080 [Candidatus Methylacidiphilales bacterium]|nr:hypothetical protein [Candidatus Methylacidiphilales bacterium]
MLLDDLLPFALWAVVAALAALPLLHARTIASLSGSRPRLKYELAFLGVIFLGLFCSRYHILVYPHELNIDESQFIAQAHGYTRTWVPFSQDGHTCGPLNYYILIWPAALGLPITYFTIRLTGFVFILLTLFYARRAVALITGNRPSYLLTLPLVSFYLFAYQNGFVHYSSEHFPDMLLAFCIWQLAKYWRLDRANFFLLGAILGATPFTKLQASPLAVYLFAVAVGLIVYHGPRRATGSWIKSLVLLALGGAVFPLIIVVPLLATGTLGDAIHRYIIIPSQYGAGVMTTELIPLPNLVLRLAEDGPQATIYFLDMMAVAVVILSLWAWREKIQRPWLAGLALAAIYLVLTIYAVLKPDLPYAHYLMFLPQPVLFLLAWIFRGYRLHRPTSLQKNVFAITCALVAISFFSLPVYLFMQHRLPHLHDPAYAKEPMVDPVSAYIKTVATPKDFMANWGYTTKYYVETDIPPGVRDFATLYEPFPNPSYDYYRDGFLDDLKKNKPKVIVDSIGESYLQTWPRPIEKARATYWKPLADYLAANYQPPVEITATPGNPPVLVYVRRADK